MATPSLVMIPSGYKSEKVYSVIPSNGDGDFTFTREGASGQPNSTRVNKAGLIEEVNSNVPRLDYSDGSCPSLLLENQSTNLLPYSEDFTQWVGASYITPNYSSSPDGTLNASRLLFTGASQELKYSLTTSSNTSGYLYVKGTSGEVIRFGLEGAESNFTLNGEWQRLEAKGTATSNKITLNTYGSTTSRDLLIWGAQLEESSISSSYIPTDGAIATRLIDQASNDFSSQPTVANTNTVVLKFIPMGFDTDFYDLLKFSDGTNDLRIEGFQTNNYDVYGSGLSASGMIDGALQLDAGSINTISFSYSGTSLRFSHNGSTIATTTPTGNLPTITEILHTTGASSPIKILKLEVYNDFKTQEELNSLTNSN